MADIFSVTAPMMIQTSRGAKKVIARCFPHREGLLYFDLYWHIADPQHSMHLLKGELKGEGPWKIDGHVINVLGCHGTDAELALQYDSWQEYIQNSTEYPPEPLILAIAKRMGAEV